MQNTGNQKRFKTVKHTTKNNKKPSAMKKIHIFKTGKHTSAAGTTHEFSESVLQDAAAVYDPQLHEAPLVIGHPKDNGPAYGWVKAVNYDEGNVSVTPHQVNADFAEMVQSGAFKKISASWYTADHPANPKPGSLYLRHVGFLGAQPPAIKGLEPVEFKDNEDQVLEFEETFDDALTLDGIGGVFKRMREFLIDKFSRDEADKVLPDYVIEDINRSAERKFNNSNKNTLPTNYNENEGEEMNLEQAQARIAELEGQNEELQSSNQALQTQVQDFQERESATRKAAIESKVDQLIAEGKVAKGMRSQAIAFAEMADSQGQSMDFGEGDDKTQATGADALIQFLGSNKAPVDFNEHSDDENEPPTPLSSRDVAAKAIQFQEEEAAAGRTVTIAQAVDHIRSQQEQ